jgi:hypothetical protein
MQMREWKGWKERVSTSSGPITRDMGGFRADRSARGIRTKMSSREIESRYTNPDKGQTKHATLIKKKTKFSSYIRKFRGERLQSHIYEEGLPKCANI